MKATKKLYDLGQSLWLDNITRKLLNSGLLQNYINELSVTGLTSNPTIFDHAIKNSTHYDSAIRKKLKKRKGEGCFSNWRSRTSPAADLFRSIYDRTWRGVWVSLEVSFTGSRHRNHCRGRGPTRQSGASQPFYQDSWHPETSGHRRSIFAGVPVNVTLLFHP
jgi:transaldolase